MAAPRHASVVVAALLLTACGSTVAAQQQRALTADAGTSSTSPQALGTLAPGQVGSVLPGRAVIPSGSSPAGVETTTPSGPAAQLPLGPGVTSTTINLGFVVQKNYNTATEAAGLGNFTNDDTRAVVDAYLAAVNKAGGVLGRRLRPVYAEYDVSSTQTNSSQEQAMCETWTHDNKVLGVLGTSGSAAGVLDTCLTRAGVLQAGSYAVASDALTQRSFPLQYLPAGVSMERFLPAYLDGLSASGWLSGKPTVALLSLDSPVFRRAGARVGRLLSARGIALKDSHYIYLGDSNAEAKRAIPQVQSALLRFHGEGVTHILVLADIGDVYLLATTTAESQKWNPHWATASPSGAALEVGTVPEDQLSTTHQVGWLPLLDRGYRQGTPTGPGYARCITTLKAAGIVPSSDQAAFNDAAICEEITFLVAGLRAGGHPDVVSFGRGVASLRDFPVATSYGTQFPGRRDGATTYRVVAYRRSCACFEFVTAAHAM